MMSLASMGSSGRSSTDDNEEHEASKTAIAAYQAREEEIERRKMEVRERVESQLTRAEEETKRLAQVWEVYVHFLYVNSYERLKVQHVKIRVFVKILVLYKFKLIK